MSYNKLFLTLISSFFIMYILMFVNLNSVQDYYTSLTRIYMALIMISPMAVLMIVMMRNMYPNPRYNRIIISVSVIIFILALTGLRLQVPVNDEQYLKAMIPHHSSAIMTSRNADIKDPEVRRLADSIISSQQREIEQMNKILERMQ